jgi:glycerol kinase
MPKYIGAIDQGTTSTRFMIIDHDGKIIAMDQKEHQQIYPKPGWVEHDPQEIWTNTVEVMRGAMVKADLKPEDLSAIGITNQRETTVIWEKASGKPICNAIVWQDTRTDGICKEIANKFGQDKFQKKTGLPLATYFSGPKIKWILDNIPNSREKAKRGEILFGNIDTWIIWNLTGEHITDGTNASRTMLMDLKTLLWDDEILEILDIPAGMLPQIRSSSEIYAYTRKVMEGIPVAGVLGDQQAALFGQVCFDPGEAKNTYGTGCFMLMNTGSHPVPSKSGLLTTLGYKLGSSPPVFALEGSVAMAGALVLWMRDNLKMIEQSADIEKLANQVEDSGGIYFVPAFSGLFAPYWRSDARGAIVGLTGYVTNAHFARAVLESAAYQTREVLDVMNKDSGVKLTSLKVDGGMVYNELLMQFQSDILNVPVIRPRMTETTALGAAYVAGLAVGYWQNLEELRKNWGKDKVWQPHMDTDQRNSSYSGWKKAVTRTFDWVE